MRFAQHLNAHITPEWRKQYIQYDEMKGLLYSNLDRAPTDPAAERLKYFARFEHEFFDFCGQEAEKINLFFKEKLAENSRKLTSLKAQLEYLVVDQDHRLKFIRLGKKQGKKMRAVKLAFTEFYLGLALLSNFQDLNHKGFRKILKKHDKLLETDTGKTWMETNIDTAMFHTNQGVNEMILDIENIMTELEGGDRQKAMKRLRVPPLHTGAGRWTTFLLGLFTGGFLTIAIKLGFLIYENVDGVTFDWHTIIRFYRPSFLINLFIFFLGLNVYGWRRNGVNHVLIFELNPRSNLAEQHFLEIAAFLSCIWGWSLVLMLVSKNIGIPLYSSPGALWIIYVLFLLLPTRFFWGSSRFWLIKTLLRVFTMPFHAVRFADFWLADQLASLTPVFLDMQYIICFYWFQTDVMKVETATIKDCTTTCRCSDPTMFIRPLIRCIPGWLRLIQCLRRCRDTDDKTQIRQHLANAAKYASTFSVVLFSTLHAVFKAGHGPEGYSSDPYLYMWILCSIITSCYSFYWDIKMDWGLFDAKVGDNKYLREEIVYNNKYIYYFAIVEDLLLRFSWAVSLSLTEMGYVQSDYMITFMAPAEIFRRFIWNFFRLENEHLNNCGEFRAVRDISIVPLKDWNQDEKTELLAVMDHADGLEVNRQRSKSSLSSKGSAAETNIIKLKSSCRISYCKLGSQHSVDRL